MSELKARVKSLRESVREVGRGLSPRYKPGREPLVIDELISPLRYDVLVRSHFFEFLDAHRGLFDTAPERFVDAVRETDYHHWYCTVAVHAIGIAGEGEATIEEAFGRRVLRSAALANSVAAQGFIAKPPLTIRSSGNASTSTGKQLGPRHYPLDGCHRLALLRQLGRRELQPGEYRVTEGSGPLLDNTARLLPALGLEEGDYLRFVASGYLGDWHGTSAEGLLADVRATAPARATELASVLAVDQLLLHPSD